MGYETWFDGEFQLDKPLSPEHLDIYNGLLNGSVPLPDGEDRPGWGWLAWEPSDDGAISIPEGGKIYYYVEWLEYLIRHFLGPWGYRLNGTVSFQGEEFDDRGTIYARDNVIDALYDEIVHPSPSWILVDLEARVARLRSRDWWAEAWGEKLTSIYRDALANREEASLIQRLFGLEYLNEWVDQMEREDQQGEADGACATE